MSYDAFISYSHGADLELAKHVRDGLQKLSKPWNRRRALSIFLDQSSLELSSQLGDSLGDRIEDTEWLVLLMSEQAAKSKWVGEEIKRWAEAKSKDRIALVLTDGTVVWDPVAKDFDYARSSAVNEHMRGVYTGQDSEPLYLDMTWTAEPGVEETLGLDNPRFRDGIATISAAIQGKSKDEVEGEDIRQHRRLVRLRRAAVTGLCLLTVAAIVAGIIALIARNEAIVQRQEAETQAKRSESRAIASDALNNAETEPDLAVLLALESGRVADTADARGSLAQVLSEPTRFLERIDVHDAFATAIAFSESGRRAATADDDGVIRLWDVNADPNPSPQATVRSERIETGANLPAMFFDGEDDLVAFSDGGSIVIVDLTTCDGTTCDIGVIDPPPDDFVFTTISPDGTLAGLTTDGFVRIFPLQDDGTFGEFVELDLGLDDIGDADVDIEMVFSPDVTHIGIGIATEVVVWAWSDGGDIWTAEVGADVTSLGFSPDDGSTPPVVAVGQVDGGIELFDVVDPELREPVADPTVSRVTDVVFRPDIVDGEFQMASTHANGEVVLWAVFAENGQPPFGAETEAMLGHNDEALALGFSPDGRIASGDYNGETIWWNDVPVSSLGRSVGPPTDDLTGEEASAFEEVAFVDDDHVAARDFSGSVWVHEVSSDTSQQIDTPAPVQSMDASNGVIAAGLDDGTTLLVDLAGTPLQMLEAGPSTVQYIALSDDAQRVVTSFIDVETQVATAVGWTLDSSTSQALELPGGFVPASLFVSDQVILVGGSSSESLPIAVAFDPATGAEVGRMQHSDREGNAVFAFAFTSDGSVLALASGDRRITLWSGVTFERLSSDEFRGHRGNITGVDFWDDETMISVDDEGQVLMWDVDERRAFAELGGPTDGLLSLDLDAEAALAVAGGEDGAVWGWSLDIDTWRQRACELAGRNMTAAEWDLYGDGTTRVRHCADFPTGDGEVVDAVYADEQPD